MKKARVFGIVIFLLILSVAAMYYFIARPAPVNHIRISTNPWVGFTPFIYAQEKGWLENTPFRFVWLNDLSDNARLYERGFTHGFTATQYELAHFKNKNTIKPVFLIDRSSGADAIFSNRTLAELRSLHEPLNVYLERGSLTEDFLEAFMQENKLEALVLHKIDMSQKNLVSLPKQYVPSVMISYQPYLSKLSAKGYQPLTSTREMSSFYVVDALFMDEKMIEGQEKEFARLKDLFALAVKRLRENPQEYYGTIYGYLEGQSYEEFMASTEEIEWLYDKPSTSAAVMYLQNHDIKTDRLIP